MAENNLNVTMIATLGIVFLFVYMSLLTHSFIYGKINLIDLLLGDDGRISKSACILQGSFLITTWVVIFLTINNRLDSGVFLSYCGAWVTPLIAKTIKNREKK